MVAQGRKVVYCGDAVYVYNPQRYLLVTLPLPLEAEIRGVRPGQPYLGFAFELDMSVLGQLILEIGEGALGPETQTQSPPLLSVSSMSPVLSDVCIRLFRALTLRDGNSQRMARVVSYIQERYERPLNVQTIARKAGMGESTLHHVFKEAVGMSPMQYLKKIRLHQARLMMVSDGLGAGEAAFRVGYGSASQFSREFKRLFGLLPSRAAETL
jgi:AraC-like DNA-binding protein